MTAFDDSDLEIDYNRAQIPDSYTVTCTSLSNQVRIKIQTPSENSPPPSPRVL